MEVFVFHFFLNRCLSRVENLSHSLKFILISFIEIYPMCHAGCQATGWRSREQRDRVLILQELRVWQGEAGAKVHRQAQAMQQEVWG